VEDVLDGIKAYFDAGLAAAITAIETARTVTIPDLAGAIRVRIDRSRQYPMMTLIPAGATHDYGDDDTPMQDHWTFFSVDIAVSHVGSEPETVQDVLIRYYEAIVDLVHADWTFGARFDRVRLGDTDFSIMTEQQQDGVLIQTLYQTLEIRVYDH